jgi:hypothetical protein
MQAILLVLVLLTYVLPLACRAKFSCVDDVSTSGQSICTNNTTGAWYQGELRDQVPHGLGVYHTRTSYYKGEWRDGLRHGRGFVVDLEHHETYRGEWFYGERHGYGVMETNKSSRYEGTWVRDKMHGRGRIWIANTLTQSDTQYRQRHKARHLARYKTGRYPATLVYDGELQFNMRHGQGTYWDPNSDSSIYEGTWQHDKPHGYGHWIHASSASDVDGTLQPLSPHVMLEYMGRWKNGRRHGYGVLRECTHDYDAAVYIYSGLWQHDRRHGQGREIVPERGIYQGEFEHGLVSGTGTMIILNGQEFHGRWSKGSPVTLYLSWYDHASVLVVSCACFGLLGWYFPTYHLHKSPTVSPAPRALLCKGIPVRRPCQVRRVLVAPLRGGRF